MATNKDQNKEQICWNCSGSGSKTETIMNAAYIGLFGFPMPETRTTTCPTCNGKGKIPKSI
ncbi:MAG TPA: hypothetical protein VJH71_03430 [Candidatus Paceibacterota bacterium]